jgi:SAM-dependent methyltransferase
VNPADSSAKRTHHWARVWSKSEPGNVSWYQESPEVSLRLIEATGITSDAHVLDVGGGASTLVDNLLERGFENVSVLDLCDSAIAHAKGRLGTRSAKIAWIIGDVTTFRASEAIELWHDRAVLHFLTEERDRDLYVQSLISSLSLDGHLIIATFALDGPKKCSGLEVVRYGPREISALFGEGFELLETVNETHLTPAEVEQRFAYFRLRRTRWRVDTRPRTENRRYQAVVNTKKTAKEPTVLSERQDKAFGEFYKSARYNKTLDPKTTLLIHLATAMSTACYP